MGVGSRESRDPPPGFLCMVFFGLFLLFHSLFCYFSVFFSVAPLPPPMVCYFLDFFAVASLPPLEIFLPTPLILSAIFPTFVTRRLNHMFDCSLELKDRHACCVFELLVMENGRGMISTHSSRTWLKRNTD